jgi:hypothetical protein
MKEPRRFEVVWTTPAGEEVARWEFMQGGPVPEGFKELPDSVNLPSDWRLTETHYMDGEFVYSHEFGSPIIAPHG